MEKEDLGKDDFLAIIGLAPDIIVQERIQKLNVGTTQLRHLATLRSQKVKQQHAASRLGLNSLRSRSPIMTRRRNEQVRQLREVLEKPHETNGLMINEVDSTPVTHKQACDPETESSSTSETHTDYSNGRAGPLFAFKRPPVSTSSSESIEQPNKANSSVQGTHERVESNSLVSAWISRASALSKRTNSSSNNHSTDADLANSKRKKVDYLKQRKSGSPMGGKSSPDMTDEVFFLSKAFGRPPSPPLPCQRGGKQPMDLELLAHKRLPDPEKAEHTLLFGNKRRPLSSFPFHSGKGQLPEKSLASVGTRTSDRARQIERKWNTSSMVLAAIRRKKALNNIGFGSSKRKRNSEDRVFVESSEPLSKLKNITASGTDEVADEQLPEDDDHSSNESDTLLSRIPSPPPLPNLKHRASSSRHTRKRLPGSLYLGGNPTSARLSSIIERAKRGQQRRLDPLGGSGAYPHGRFERSKPALLGPTVQMPFAALFPSQKKYSKFGTDEPVNNQSGASVDASQANGVSVSSVGADSLSNTAALDSAASSPIMSLERRRRHKRRHTTFAPMVGSAIAAEAVPDGAKCKEDDTRPFSFSHSQNPGQSCWSSERAHSIERSAPSILQRASRSERIGQMLPTLLHLTRGRDREPNRFLGSVSITDLANAQAMAMAQAPPAAAPVHSLHTSSIAPQPQPQAVTAVTVAVTACASTTPSPAPLLPQRAFSAPAAQLVLPGMTLQSAAELQPQMQTPTGAPRPLTALQLLQQKKRLSKQMSPASQTAIC